MKKLIAAFLAAALATLGLSAAQNGNAAKKAKDTAQKKGETQMEQTSKQGKKILVAYFSRTGEQYSVGFITKGNTEIIAEIIAAKTGADLFEIKPAEDKYPAGYSDLTKYSKKEMQNNERPEIAGDVKNFADYGTIFIGYPVWWGDKPMPVYTFIEKHDFKDKTIVPFATHEGSGFCGTQGMAKTGAKVLKGIGIYGHVAQNDRKKAEKQVSEWLTELGIIKK